MRLALCLMVLMASINANARDSGRLIIYGGHARPDVAWVTGRFVEDEGFREPSASRHRLVNLWDNLRQLESDEIEGARLEVTLGERREQVTTDSDGVFAAEFRGLHLAPGEHTVRVVPLETQGHPTAVATGRVFALPEGPVVAVVSDFDDTLVVSHITDTKRMLKTALLRNAAQLTPVTGAAAALRHARQRGAVAVFYLSGSPQNFFLRVQSFLKNQGFPDGPVLLKNLGEDSFDQETYKLGRLRTLLARHPQLKLVLVGDSGERDPEIYRRLAEENPGRVVGMVIRRVPGDASPPERFAGQVVVQDFAEMSISSLVPQR